MHVKRNPNVKFLDYHFDLAPNGTIIMDKELTLEHIKSSVGDLFIIMVNDDGCVEFVPCDTQDVWEDDDYADMSLSFIVHNNKD